LDQASGHDLRSVTKRFVGALVGIALAEGKMTSLDQTVGALLPALLPTDADPSGGVSGAVPRQRNGGSAGRSNKRQKRRRCVPIAEK
jgi:CubicO group peptidase (beta-lactamase class C family)